MVRFKNRQVDVLCVRKEMAQFVIDIGQMQEKSALYQRYAEEVVGKVYVKIILGYVTDSRNNKRIGYFTTYARKQAVEKAIILAHSAESKYAYTFNPVELLRDSLEAPYTCRRL